MTRKEIVTNTYGYGGLLGAIGVFIFIFIYYSHETLFTRFFFSTIMMIISPGIIGCVLGAVAFILTLPFYRSIPWDIEENIAEDDSFSTPEKIFGPIKKRWEILDLS